MGSSRYRVRRGTGPRQVDNVMDINIYKLNKLISLLVVVIFVLSVTIPVSAASNECSEDLLKNLSVAIVNCTGNQEVCSASNVNPSADIGENAEIVWIFFADKLPSHQIAGIIGNMTAESSVQPQRLQGTKPGVITPAESVNPGTDLGWGLVQWTPARKIINTFPEKSQANSINNQLDFLWKQLSGQTASPEKSAGDQLKATKTVVEATEVFAKKYERPAAESLAKSLKDRVSSAEAAHLRFKDLIPTTTTPVGYDNNATTGSVGTECGSTSSGIDSTGIIGVAQSELAKAPVEYDSNVLKYSDGNEEAWCADFVSWVHKEAGVPYTGGSSGGWRRASVLDLQSMYKNSPNYKYFNVGSDTPQPGDVAFYIGSQTPDGGSNRHVNIVIEVNGDTMTTIGGNESNKVKKSTRKISVGSQGLVGFGRIVK